MTSEETKIAVMQTDIQYIKQKMSDHEKLHEKQEIKMEEFKSQIFAKMEEQTKNLGIYLDNSVKSHLRDEGRNMFKGMFASKTVGKVFWLYLSVSLALFGFFYYALLDIAQK